MKDKPRDVWTTTPLTVHLHQDIAKTVLQHLQLNEAQREARQNGLTRDEIGLSRGQRKALEQLNNSIVDSIVNLETKKCESHQQVEAFEPPEARVERAGHEDAV